MKIYFDENGTLAGLKGLICRALSDGAGGLAVLACEENGFDRAGLDALLRSVDKPLTGGLFPAVIYGGKACSRGSVVLGFGGKAETAVIKDISSPSTDFEPAMEGLADRAAGASTMILFTDGFAERNVQFTSSLFDIFGLAINYVGGGAGSLKSERIPCVFTNEGVLRDAAALLLVECRSGVGVAHGWRPIGEPMLVTGAEGNKLLTLDLRNAFEVYVEKVAADTGVSFGKEDFPQVSRGYPFGIARIDMEMIVRDPLKVTPEGYFIFPGEIPKDAYISILTSDEQALLAASAKAGGRAAAALQGGEPEDFLIIDCISRLLSLKDRFGSELAGMTPPHSASAGACTIGEIANSGTEFLEFYNKTAVVAAMGKE